MAPAKSIDERLTDAVENGDAKSVRKLLRRGADANAQDSSKYYPSVLHKAIKNDDLATCELLVKFGANPEVSGFHADSALNTAVFYTYVDIVKLLLDADGADVNSWGPSGSATSALEISAEKNHTEILHNLLEHGASGLNDALRSAARSGELQGIKILIAKGADLNDVHAMQGTALHSAAESGCSNAVEYLLKEGANVNAQGGRFGDPLQAAAEGGSLETVKALLVAGADANAQGGRYGGALQVAAFEGYKEIIDILLESDADVNAYSHAYGNSLNAAVRGGSKEVIDRILDAGADITRQPWSPSRQSVLHLATVFADLAIVSKVCSRGAGIHLGTEDENGRTPLHEAVMREKVDIVKYLIEQGASPDVEDLNGRCPLITARDLRK